MREKGTKNRWNKWKSNNKVTDLNLHISIITFFNLFIYYLFLVALGLCCCAQAFSSCSESGLLFVAVRGLLVAVASLVVEHGL